MSDEAQSATDPQAAILAEVERVEREAEAAVQPNFADGKPGCCRCGRLLDGEDFDVSPFVSYGVTRPACRMCFERMESSSGPQGGNPSQEQMTCGPAGIPWHGMTTGPCGALPLADLCERIAILVAAGVESYEDGPLRLRFNADLKHRDDKRQPTGDPLF